MFRDKLARASFMAYDNKSQFCSLCNNLRISVSGVGYGHGAGLQCNSYLF